MFIFVSRESYTIIISVQNCWFRDPMLIFWTIPWSGRSNIPVRLIIRKLNERQNLNYISFRLDLPEPSPSFCTPSLQKASMPQYVTGLLWNRQASCLSHQIMPYTCCTHLITLFTIGITLIISVKILIRLSVAGAVLWTTLSFIILLGHPFVQNLQATFTPKPKELGT